MIADKMTWKYKLRNLQRDLYKAELKLRLHFPAYIPDFISHHLDKIGDICREIDTILDDYECREDRVFCKDCKYKILTDGTYRCKHEDNTRYFFDCINGRTKKYYPCEELNSGCRCTLWELKPIPKTEAQILWDKIKKFFKVGL